eukprot:scaffold298007_cov39-Prasinocladus_malaysianus.AAC.1
MFGQGMLEKSKGMEASPLCDDEKDSLTTPSIQVARRPAAVNLFRCPISSEILNYPEPSLQECWVLSWSCKPNAWSIREGVFFLQAAADNGQKQHQ